MATRYVLDTNIFSAILRNEPKVIARITEALATGDEFFMCPVVFYQVYRGLLHRDAKKQMGFFLSYTTTFTRSDFNSTDWQKAAELWADLRSQGEQAEDADLLIGVYALQRGAVVITDNEKDFVRFGVSIENWRR